MHQILATETFEMAHIVYVHPQCDKTVIQVTNASILRAENQGTWRQDVPMKLCYLSTWLHVAIPLMTATFIVNAMKTTNLT